MSRVLVVDIGNTSTSIALMQKGRILKFGYQPSQWNSTSKVATFIDATLGREQFEGAVLCSVVPDFNRKWQLVLKRMCGRETVVVGCRTELGVSLVYPKPETIGADRLANACYVAHKFKGPVIVADFGTAVTFDVVTAEKEYIGGVIAPGLPLMTDYLYERTALLPHISLKDGARCHFVGKSTESAMRIGAQIGYRGMVREIVRHVTSGLKMKSVILCATGGFARWALRGIDMPFKFDPYLTLRGLERVWKLNERSV